MTRDTSVPIAITEITRRALIDEINLAKLNRAGRLEEQAFLARLYDLTAMPSRDPRFSDAGSDIWQHRVNNYDWDDDWVFCDTRFDPDARVRRAAAAVPLQDGPSGRTSRPNRD